MLAIAFCLQRYYNTLVGISQHVDIKRSDNMKYLSEIEFEKNNLFGKGILNTMFSQYFSGNSYLKLLTKPEIDPLFMLNVTFEPGCRNNWHIHKAIKNGGQILICIAGEGWYQEEGKKPVSLLPGTIINIPANVKHWHGAKADSWFSHIAIELPGEKTSNEWCEEVTEKEYLSIKE